MEPALALLPIPKQYSLHIMTDEGEARQRFTLIASYHKQVSDLLQTGPQNQKSINICKNTLPQLWNMHSLEQLSPLLSSVTSPIFRKPQILHFHIQPLHIPTTSEISPGQLL